MHICQTMEMLILSGCIDYIWFTLNIPKYIRFLISLGLMFFNELLHVIFEYIMKCFSNFLAISYDRYVLETFCCVCLCLIFCKKYYNDHDKLHYKDICQTHYNIKIVMTIKCTDNLFFLFLVFFIIFIGRLPYES